MQGIDKSSIKSHCCREWRCCCSTHCRWILHSKVGSYEAKAYESVTSTWLVTIGLSVRDAGGSSSTCMHVRCYAPHQLQSYNFCTCSVHLRDVKITLRLLSLNFTRQFRRPIPSVIWLPWSKWIQCLPLQLISGKLNWPDPIIGKRIYPSLCGSSCAQQSP